MQNLKKLNLKNTKKCSYRRMTAILNLITPTIAQVNAIVSDDSNQGDLYE
jgi:hypothetical protein